MAGATNTTLGTIKLAGDFIGGHAEAPALRPSGVKADTYNITDKIYVDAQGRITWAKQLPEDFEWPEASKTTDGVVQIGKLYALDNNSIDINTSTSVISINTASSSNSGVVKIGQNLSKDSQTGKTDVIIPFASTTQYGNIKTSTGINLSNDSVISLDMSNHIYPTATITSSGFAKITAGDKLTISDGILSAPLNKATPNSFGFVRPGGNLYLAPELTADVADSVFCGLIKPNTDYFNISNGEINFKTTSKTNYGLVGGAGTNIDITDGLMTCDAVVTGITVASSTVFGGIKLGSGFSTTAGILKIADATYTEKGIFSGGTGTKIIDGNISLDIPIATLNSVGAIKPGNGLITDTNSVLTINSSTFGNNATTSTAGVVKIGSSAFQMSNGVLSCTVFEASTVNRGGVVVGHGLTVSNGVVYPDFNTNICSENSYGYVQGGDGFSITDGTISTTRAATSSVFGLVKLSQAVISSYIGLDITDGTLSALTAKSNIAGILYPNDPSLSLTDYYASGFAALSIVPASASVYGILKAPAYSTSVYSSIHVDASGFLNISPSTTIIDYNNGMQLIYKPGLVKIGSGMSVNENGSTIVSNQQQFLRTDVRNSINSYNMLFGETLDKYDPTLLILASAAQNRYALPISGSDKSIYFIDLGNSSGASAYNINGSVSLGIPPFVPAQVTKSSKFYMVIKHSGASGKFGWDGGTYDTLANCWRPAGSSYHFKMTFRDGLTLASVGQTDAPVDGYSIWECYTSVIANNQTYYDFRKIFTN